MADFYAVVMIGCLVIGFICGRYRVKLYSGEIAVTPDGGSFTLSLDIPREEISQYSELLLRVVPTESRNV